GIIELNEKGQGISDPYHHLGEVAKMKQGFTEKARPENFKDRSYILESVVLLCTSRGWRAILPEFWKSIISLDYAEFIPATLWQRRGDYLCSQAVMDGWLGVQVFGICSASSSSAWASPAPSG